MGTTEEGALRQLRCATAGSVDDGKSTLIGRLLLDSKALLVDQLASIEEASRRRGHARTDLALVTDGLRAEREQGITIDVAWRYFATPRRRFVLADAPGHVQYTRNMVTAASVADVAIILVDARHGLVEQTRRHLFVVRLLGVPRVCVAINKMDQVGFDAEVFARIREGVAGYLAALPLPGRAPPAEYFPISALGGDNVVEASRAMPWYDGKPLLAHLEALPTEGAEADAPARLSVQWVIRPQSDEHHDYRGLAGRVASGTLRPGDRVAVWPGALETTIARVEVDGDDVEEARAGASVVVHLADDLDVGRGALIATLERPPSIGRTLEADVAWLSPTPAREGATVLVKHGTREVRAALRSIVHRYDVTTGAAAPGAGEGLALNGLARVSLRLAEDLAVDRYEDLRATGSFLVIEPSSGETLAGGMIRGVE